MAEKTAALLKTCLHCGDSCPQNAGTPELPFCCSGCKMVYELLQENDFQKYYCLNEKPGNTVGKMPATKYAALDDEATASRNISYRDKEKVIASFYLPQIHCSSCLWLLENLSRLQPAILGSKVNFVAKKLSITFKPASFSLRQLAELLALLGYAPQLQEAAEDENKDASNKQAIIKIGVAFFCFANIMLFSFPEYLGLNASNNPEFLSFFRYANLVLSVPVLVYCARGFFVNAWKGLRQRYVNIDAPIVVAILVCFFRSVVDILQGTGSGYLDSMAGIVLLMLTGRHLQNKTFNAMRFNRSTRSFFPIGVAALKDGLPVFTKVEDLKKGDHILLSQEEVIPLDCVLSAGTVQVNNSFITGEAEIVTVSEGEYLYAGGKIAAGSGEALVAKTFSQNGFLNLWEQSDDKKYPGKTTGFTDQLSRYFSFGLLCVAATAFIYWQFTTPSLSWKVVTSVLLIACPCTLLLASSFLHGFLLNRFAAKGFYLKNYGVIEKLTRATKIIFDKTGTLTDARPASVHFVGKALLPEDEQVFLSLLSLSRHPLSRAIAGKKTFDRIFIEHYKERTGEGMEAWFANKHYKAGSAIFITGQQQEIVNGSAIFLSVDGQLMGYYKIINQVRRGVDTMIKRLAIYEPILLSGDNDYSKESLAKVFPAGAALHYKQGPAQKLKIVQGLQQEGKNVMMLGDGLNDAGALAAANVGIAVADQSFSFTPACDAILQVASLPALAHFIIAAHKAKKLVFAMLFFSLLYNVVGLYFALTAQLNPLIAAILMPSSSLSVIAIAFAGAKKIAGKVPAPIQKHD